MTEYQSDRVFFPGYGDIIIKQDKKQQPLYYIDNNRCFQLKKQHRNGERENKTAYRKFDAYNSDLVVLQQISIFLTTDNFSLYLY